MAWAPLRYKRDVGKRPHTSHGSHERRHDPTLIPSRNHGNHHLPITETITLLPKGKAPGHDGIPIEFFQIYVNGVAPTLLVAFKAMLARGLTWEYINKGMITLIPKSEDHSKLGNWHPITLLGSIYKILAKTLGRRIQEFLLLVIKPIQTGFVKGRSILDNNFLVQEALI